MGRIKVDKDIPIDEDRFSKYPFGRMNKGESFFIPMEELMDSNHPTQLIHGAVGKFNQRHPDKKFITRKRNEKGVVGWRVWRTK